MGKSYPEIHVARDSGDSPVFPSFCPICGALADRMSWGEQGPGSGVAVYSCGGQYVKKQQIQTHTSKWWGHCGKAGV